MNYKHCLIKDLPPVLRQMAVNNCIASKSYKSAGCKTEEEALKLIVNDFEWCRTSEGQTFWHEIYNGNILQEYLTEQYEIY